MLPEDDEGVIRAIQNSVEKGTVIALSDFIGKAYNKAWHSDFERFVEKIVLCRNASPEIAVSAEEPIQWRTVLSGSKQ